MKKIKKVKKNKKINSNRAFVHLDLIFAISIFLIFFYIISEYTYKNYDFYEKNTELKDYNYDAKDLCFILTKQSGVPNNWENDISLIDIPGLRNIENSSLNQNKINSFNLTNYFNITDSLNINKNLYIEINGVNSTTNYLQFGYEGNYINYYSSFTCYSNYQNEVVEVTVEVWK